MKCALPGMYGRKVPIDYAALSKSYLDITKEYPLSKPEDDFHNVIKELEKNHKDLMGFLTYYYEREFLMDHPYDDFHKVIEEYKKMLENVLENMDLDSDINKIKKHNYEKELEALKQYLIQKDKEEHSQ